MHLFSPFDFKEGNIEHKHDPNPRVTTWSCKNGHEFESRGKIPCLGCLIEENVANCIARERVNNTPTYG